jgi:hypothetical protein
VNSGNLGEEAILGMESLMIPSLINYWLVLAMAPLGIKKLDRLKEVIISFFAL